MRNMNENTLFKVTHVRRIESRLVECRIEMTTKAWNEAKKDLGYLFGIEISNYIYREYGVKAYNPMVDGIRDKSKKGIKYLSLTYEDTEWKPIDNVIKVDFENKRKVA